MFGTGRQTASVQCSHRSEEVLQHSHSRHGRFDSAIEAVMHYRTWEAHDGHHNPFRLNGHEHLNEGKNHHYDYDLLPIPVTELQTGD